MPKFHVTMEFNSEEEMIRHFSGKAETRVTESTDDATEQTNDSDVDSDGMPYDPDIHTETKAVNADGTWKARRGKADEAKAAREAFKAAGAGVTPPAAVVETTVAPAMPGSAPAPAATRPGMPGAAPAPAPVSFDRVFSKLTGMFEAGKIDSPTALQFYEKSAGTSDAAAAANIYQTNETARASLFKLLCEIEPEL